jgi:hypothetical protein
MLIISGNEFLYLASLGAGGTLFSVVWCLGIMRHDVWR